MDNAECNEWTLMNYSLRGTATLLGFVLGISGAGVAVTASALSLLVTMDRIAQIESFMPSLSSAIALTLAATTLVISFFLIKGSLWIWRFSVYGGALNLAISFVAVLLSYGNLTLLSVQIVTGSLRDFLLASYLFTSFSSMASGILGSAAHHEQLTRRFAQSSLSDSFRVLVVVNDNEHDIEVSGSTTGGDLKDRVCKLEGVPSQNARLLFGGRAIKDNATLKELGLGEGDRFTLVTE